MLYRRLLSSFGLVLIFVSSTGCGSKSEPNSKPTDGLKLEAPYAARPDRVTLGVKKLAEGLPTEPDKFAAALKQKLADQFTARDVLVEPLGIPINAGDLAVAVGEKKHLTLSSFERISLIGAIAEHLNIPHEYGYFSTSKGGATELLAREFTIALNKQNYTDQLTLAKGAIIPLSETDWMANVLGFRALGIMAKEPNLALKLVQKATSLNPKDDALAFVLAKAEMTNGDVAGGIERMKSVAERSADELTYYTLGRIAFLDEKPFVATQYFHKAIEKDPKFVPAYTDLAELTLERLELTPHRQRPQVIEQANEWLQKAKAIDPNAKHIHIIAAHIAALKEDPEEAKRLLREEIRQNPKSLEGYLILAESLASGHVSEAIAVCEQAIGQGIDDGELWMIYGALLASDTQFEKALEALKKALVLLPDDPQLRPQLAQLYSGLNQPAAAVSSLNEQLKKFPQDATSRLLLAQLMLNEKRYDRALEHIDEVLKQADEEQLTQAQVIRYLTLVVAKRPTEQISAGREKALSIIGKRSALAEILLENGEVDEATLLLTEAVAKDSEDLRAPILLVALWTVTGKETEAQALREKTLASLEESERAAFESLFDEATDHALKAKAEVDGSQSNE